MRTNITGGSHVGTVRLEDTDKEMAYRSLIDIMNSNNRIA